MIKNNIDELNSIIACLRIYDVTMKEVSETLEKCLIAIPDNLALTKDILESIEAIRMMRK